NGERLEPGLYDVIVTRGLEAKLAPIAAELRRLEPVDASDAPLALARLLSRRLFHALDSLSGDDRLARQIELANEILELLRARAREGGADPEDAVPAPPSRLLAILEAAEPPARPYDPPRPPIPLTTSDLLVNGRGDLSLGPALAREIRSADRIDVICAFLRWNGFRLLEDALEDLLSRRPGALRVLTTTYLGATERRVLDALERLGAAVRVSYDTDATRLHAK